MRATNEAVRFLLEVATLLALGVWGWRAASATVGRAALGIGIPVVVAVLWGRWVAPKSPTRLPDPARLIVEVVVFAAAISGIAAAGAPVLAAVFSLVIAVNLGLMLVWSQR